MPTKLQLQKRIQELEEEDAREAVLQALEKLSAGTTRAEIKNARD